MLVMVSIKEAKNKRNDINVSGTVESVSEPRTVNTRYGSAKVCDAYLTDGVDKIKLSLWGDDIDKVKNGDQVEITGAYTSTFRNEVQLNIPKKNGEIKVV